MRLVASGKPGPRLVVDEEHVDVARLVVWFPPQHIGEEALLETDPTPAPSVLAAARVARFSRLAFAVAAAEEIAFSSDGVLAAMRRLPLVVVPAATPRSDPRPGLGSLVGHLHLPGGLVLAESVTGPVMTGPDRGNPAPVGAAVVDDLLRGSTALRTARIRLANAVAVDVRRVSDISRGIETGLFGSGGELIVPDLPRFPRRPTITKARAPKLDETAIEAPWRLILSPSAAEGFTHADAPVGPADPLEPLGTLGVAERIELWHSRLGMRRVVEDADGAETVTIDERPDRQRIVRAVWAREREQSDAQPDLNAQGPFRSSLSPADRWELVLQTSETLTDNLGKITPEPVDVKALALSSLGAWLDVHGGWNASSYSKRGIFGALESWDHIAPMGRDQFVQVVSIGYLFTLGHKAVLIKQTERKIRTAADPVARLYQRYFIVVAQPERTHGIRDLPFTNVRFLTLVTPPLAVPADLKQFWPKLPNGQDVIFTVETVDHDGRHARFRTPLLYLDAAMVDPPGKSAAPINAAHRPDPRAAIPAEGQRVAFAPSAKPGDTSAEVRTLRLIATIEGDAATSTGRYLQPRLHAAEIVPATSRLLTPAAETFSVNYHPTFVEKGFPAAAGTGDNKTDLFLQVVDASRLTDETIPLPLPGNLPQVKFGSTDRSGGFVDPAQQIAGLSRRLGTVGDLSGALAGSFDPVAMLGNALPKLFGLFKLTDLLGAIGLDEAPKFVTEALGPVQGCSRISPHWPRRSRARSHRPRPPSPPRRARRPGPRRSKRDWRPRPATWPRPSMP